MPQGNNYALFVEGDVYACFDMGDFNIAGTLSIIDNDYVLEITKYNKENETVIAKAVITGLKFGFSNFLDELKEFVKRAEL